MKAVSPVRPARRSGLAEPGLGGGRGKSPADEPPRLLYDMDGCYSRLRALVPSIPRDRKVSRVEILQHVIDYILDLQLALDAQPARPAPRPRPGPRPAARPPLAALNADAAGGPAPQAPEFPSSGSKALCG